MATGSSSTRTRHLVRVNATLCTASHTQHHCSGVLSIRSQRKNSGYSLQQEKGCWRNTLLWVRSLSNQQTKQHNTDVGGAISVSRTIIAERLFYVLCVSYVTVAGGGQLSVLPSANDPGATAEDSQRRPGGANDVV